MIAYTLRDRNRIGNLFNDFFDWPLDHVEDNDCYEFEVNLAGFSKDNINVNIEDGLLHVKAEQGERKFSRHWSVPNKIDPNATIAKYEDGLLHIKLNKKEEEKGVNVRVN